jgi:hypothetical protein
VDGTTVFALYGAVVAPIAAAAQVHMQVTVSRARRQDAASVIFGRLNTLLFLRSGGFSSQAALSENLLSAAKSALA